MIKVNVSDLSGHALDWAVAQVEGVTYNRHYLSVSDFSGPEPVYTYISNYSPSTDWSKGGPLIAKYQMDLTFERTGLVYSYRCGDDGLPAIPPHVECYGSFGETHLIAVCRAICAEKLGAEIEVPDELLKKA